MDKVDTVTRRNTTKEYKQKLILYPTIPEFMKPAQERDRTVILDSKHTPTVALIDNDYDTWDPRSQMLDNSNIKVGTNTGNIHMKRTSIIQLRRSIMAPHEFKSSHISQIAGIVADIIEEEPDQFEALN